MGVMPMYAGMTPNLLTAWRPEKDGRGVKWAKLGAMRCRWDRSGSVAASASGDSSSLSADIILPCVEDDAPLHPKDRVALGARIDDGPSGDALAVVSCHPVYLGGAHPHHWEAHAQ